MAPRLALFEVAKTVGNKRLFNDLSFEVQAGEVCAIVGPSGCGKSTLLSIIGLMDTPDEGLVFVDGENLTAASRRQRQRAYRDTYGFVFQDFGLVDDFTVGRNVEAALSTRKKPSAKALEALQTVGLGTREAEFPAVLSGGEKQRVAIARILASRPNLILADEPTGSLDARNRDIVMAAFEQLASDGAAVVIVTHDPAVAARSHRRVDLGARAQ